MFEGIIFFIIFILLFILFSVWCYQEDKKGIESYDGTMDNGEEKVPIVQKTRLDSIKDRLGGWNRIYLGDGLWSNDFVSYDELLDTDEWERKRDRILKRDGGRCRYCRKDWNLQVHHKYYNKVNVGHERSMLVVPWDYPDDALITLCRDCHRKEHERKNIRTYWRKRGLHYNL